MPPPAGGKSLCSPTAAGNSCEHLQNQTEPEAAVYTRNHPTIGPVGLGTVAPSDVGHLV